MTMDEVNISFSLKGFRAMATPISSATTSPTASCISGLTPDKNGYVPPEACNANYSYYPSFAAAVIFSVIFGLVFTVHLIQGIAYRKVSKNTVICMPDSFKMLTFLAMATRNLHGSYAWAQHGN